MSIELTGTETRDSLRVSRCVESCLACYRACQQCVSATILRRDPRRADALRLAVECGAACLTFALLAAAASDDAERAAGVLLSAARHCAAVAREPHDACWADCAVLCTNVSEKVVVLFPSLEDDDVEPEST